MCINRENRVDKVYVQGSLINIPMKVPFVVTETDR